MNNLIVFLMKNIGAKSILEGVNSLYALGDSITAGQDATTTANRYINQLASELNALTLTNLAVGARAMWRAMDQIATQTYIRAEVLITVMASLNDMKRAGNNALTLKKTEAGVKFIIRKHAAVNSIASGSSSVTRTGSFNPFNARSFGGTYTTGTLPGNFASFNAAGGVCTWSYTFTGTAIAVVLIGADNVTVGSTGYGTADIKIDTVVVESVDMGGVWYDGISDGAYDNAKGPVTFMFHGLSAGSHTIEVVTNGDGFVPVDSFNILDPTLAGPILFSEIPYNTAAGYALSPNLGSEAISDIYSALIESIVNEFIALGYPLRYGRVNDVFDPVNTTDGVHPNDLGHDQITAALKRFLF